MRDGTIGTVEENSRISQVQHFQNTEILSLLWKSRKFRYLGRAAVGKFSD